MSTDYHTPIDDTFCYNRSEDVEAPLGELDAGIAASAVTIAENVAAIEALQTQPYDIPIMWNGVLTDGLVLIRVEMVREVTIPAGLTLSRLKAIAAATGSSVFSLKKNGTEFGTMTFAAAATIATLAAATETILAIGDLLTFVGPATADTTLADLYGMLTGTR